MRLTIHNKTDYRKDDLRKITLACMKHLGIDPDKRHVAHFEHRRSTRHYISGYAYLNTGSFWIKIPKRLAYYEKGAWNPTKVAHDALPAKIVRYLAAVIMHELQHCMGFNHDEMANIYDDAYTADCPWIADMQVRRAGLERKAANPVDNREATARRRLAQAEERIKNLASQTKRANTILKKWRAKVKYYDKRKEEKGEV